MDLVSAMASPGPDQPTASPPELELVGIPGIPHLVDDPEHALEIGLRQPDHPKGYPSARVGASMARFRVTGGPGPSGQPHHRVDATPSRTTPTPGASRDRRVHSKRCPPHRHDPSPEAVGPVVRLVSGGCGGGVAGVPAGHPRPWPAATRPSGQYYLALGGSGSVGVQPTATHPHGQPTHHGYAEDVLAGQGEASGPLSPTGGHRLSPGRPPDGHDRWR